jgi:hypothetical protein
MAFSESRDAITPVAAGPNPDEYALPRLASGQRAPRWRIDFVHRHQGVSRRSAADSHMPADRSRTRTFVAMQLLCVGLGRYDKLRNPQS